MKVGSTKQMLENMKQEIVVGDGRLWFIGEHTNPEVFSFANGAYDSGRNAAKKALTV